MNFHQAFETNDLIKMEIFYNEIQNHFYYMDVAVETGKKEVVNFYLNKGVKPSLYAVQMARINGYGDIAFLIEQYPEPIYRNMINVKHVHSYYDSKLKQFVDHDILEYAKNKNFL